MSYNRPVDPFQNDANEGTGQWSEDQPIPVAKLDVEPEIISSDQPRTPAQVARLEQEWQRLQRDYAFHPAVRIEPIGALPPGEYQVQYKLRTLAVVGTGQLDFVSDCWVHIWLPPDFPERAPLVRPMSALFHPNVTMEMVLLTPPWKASNSLVDVIVQVGKMLAYQVIDRANPWNESAIAWINDNPHELPLDEKVDLTPTAGGAPLERIKAGAPKTIESIQRRLDEITASLATSRGPTQMELIAQCEKQRAALRLFAAEDLPAEIRAAARDLDIWARELPDTLPAWEGLRRKHSAAFAISDICHRLRETQLVLSNSIKHTDNMVPRRDFADVQEALKAIPATPTLYQHQGNLATIIGQTEQELTQLRERAKSPDITLSTQPPKTRSKGLLDRYELELKRINESIEKSRAEAAAEKNQTQPVLEEARGRHQGLSRMAGWKEYFEQFDKAEDLARKIEGWGAAGVGAFFVDVDSGRFGPFEFEKKLSLGASDFGVRNNLPTLIEVFNPENGRVIGQDDRGFVTVGVKNPQGGRESPAVFRLTGRCDELAVQLEYLAAQTQDSLAKLRGPLSAGDSWMSALHEFLNASANQQSMRSRQDEHEQRWAGIVRDLNSLHPFKNRLATYRMLMRGLDLAERLNKSLNAARKTLADTADKLGKIVAASNMNLETGNLQIPARYAQEYQDSLKRRGNAKIDIERLNKLMQSAARDIRERLNSSELLGTQVMPQTQHLEPMAPEIMNLVREMSNQSIEQMVGRISQLLHQPLEIAPLSPDSYIEPEAEPQPEPQAQPQEITPQQAEDLSSGTVYDEQV